ncbi:MAG: glycosyltransferase family 61 protein [Alphaproteobacteria bacterium]|nr:glycosyltransferase family 61 protein [Alphaproteobacteria bacterium]
MSNQLPGAIAARRSAIQRLSEINPEGALEELALDLKQRPATPEQAFFLKSWMKRAFPTATLIQLLASALLEDGDPDSAVAAFAALTKSLPQGRVVLLAHHLDLAGYCRSNGFHVAPANGFELEPIKAIDLATTTYEPTFVAELRSGFVIGESFGVASPSGHAFWNRTIFNPNRAVRHDAAELLPPLIVATGTRCLAQVTDMTSHGPAVLVGDSPNFGHWLLNHASRLALIDHRPDLKSLPIVVGANTPACVLETLRLLGREPSLTIRVGKNELAQFETLWIPDMPFCGSLGGQQIKISRRAVKWLRDALGAHAQPRKKTRRIFVSRADAARRRIVNETEILSRLGSLGFECILPSALSVREQVDLAAESECIVGGFGAGMAVSYLAPSGSRIVEIGHPAPAMRVQHPLCRILGQHFFRIEARSIGETPSNVNDDVEIDPNLVLSAVTSALENRGG